MQGFVNDRTGESLVDEAELQRLFASCGKCLQVELQPSTLAGGEPYALVKMATAQGFDTALKARLLVPLPDGARTRATSDHPATPLNYDRIRSARRTKSTLLDAHHQCASARPKKTSDQR